MTLSSSFKPNGKVKKAKKANLTEKSKPFMYLTRAFAFFALWISVSIIWRKVRGLLLHTHLSLSLSIPLCVSLYMHTQVYIERDRGTYGEVERHRETEREREMEWCVCSEKWRESQRDGEMEVCAQRDTETLSQQGLLCL